MKEYTPRRTDPRGLEKVGGETVGRDPRRMTEAELNELGHYARPLLEAIRESWLWLEGSADEVRKSILTGHPLWPYRHGTNPFARRNLTDAQRAASRERLAAARSKRKAAKPADAVVEAA